MRDFVILADSTADLSKDIRERYSIEYVPMNYVADGVEYPASLDWESHSVKEFYDMMRAGKRILTTQVPREIYTEIFSKYLKQGKDVLYIACSSALSGSVNLAKVVADSLAEKYSDRKIICIDSLCSSLGQGCMLIAASEMRAAGKTIKETAQQIENNKLKVNQFGTVESLDYLKKAGRVKASNAFFGNMFGIKPIIISDKIGQNYALEKVKGARNAKTRIAEHIAEVVSKEGPNCLYISHADCLEEALLLRDMILEKVAFEHVVIGTIGPIVGSCVGPGTVIAFCYGKEVEVEGKE